MINFVFLNIEKNNKVVTNDQNIEQLWVKKKLISHIFFFIKKKKKS